MIVLAADRSGKLNVQPPLSCSDVCSEATLRDALVAHADDILGDDVMVIGTEVRVAVDGERMRFDVLAITADLRLVILEVKVAETSAATLDDQITKYALAADQMSWRQVVKVFHHFSGSDRAEEVLSRFAGIEDHGEPLLGAPHVLLVVPTEARRPPERISKWLAAGIDVQQVLVHASQTPSGTVIVMDESQMKRAPRTRKGRNVRRAAFWDGFMEQAHKRKQFMNVAARNHLIQESAGVQGIRYILRLLQHEVILELYIELGPHKQRETKELYRQIFNLRHVIEQELGVKLQWCRSNYHRACSVRWIMGRCPARS